MKAVATAMFVIGLFLTSAWAAQAGNVYELGVDGLGCPFCAYGIEKELGAVAGVDKVDIDLESGVVVVTMASERILDADTAKQAVEEAGFDLRSFAPTSEE